MVEATNKLASSVAAYTPRSPVSHADADAIRAMVTESLHSLAKSVDEYLSANGNSSDVSSSHDEEIIIITSPPPR